MAKRRKKKRIRCQYTCLTALSFIMLAFAVLGYMANGQFSDSVVETGGALDITSDYFNELKGFIRTTREPLQYIGKHVSTVIGTIIFPLLNDSTLISEGTSNLTARLGNFSTAYENKTVNVSDGTNNEVFDCFNCSIISEQVNAAKEQIIEDTAPMFKSLEQTRISLGSELVEQNNTIVSVCSSVDDLIGAAETGVDDYIASYEKEIRPEVIKWNSLRTLVFSLLFTFPLLPIILTILTMLTKKTIFLTCQNGLTWLTCSLVTAIVGVHLGITIVLSDVCEFNDVVLVKGVKHIGHLQNAQGDIVQACFDNTRLIDVFNMSDQLDFGAALQMDLGFNASAAFEVSIVDYLQESTANTDISTFNGKGDADLETCNDLVAKGQITSPILTRDNIASASASTYYTSAGVGRSRLQSAINAAKITVNLEISAASDFTNIIQEMQSDMDSIANYTADLKNDTRVFEERSADVNNQMSPIMNASNRLLDTRCGFIGTTYRRLDNTLCLNLAPSVAAMSLSMILVIMMLIPVCCIGICLKGNLQSRENIESSIFNESRHSRMNSSHGSPML